MGGGFQALRAACRELVPLKYGPEPYRLELKLRFPESMPDYAERGAAGTVQIEMAPLAAMPYSVLTFLDMVRPGRALGGWGQKGKVTGMRGKLSGIWQ